MIHQRNIHLFTISKSNTIKFSSCHGPQKIKFPNTKSLFVVSLDNQPARTLLAYNLILTTANTQSHPEQ